MKIFNADQIRRADNITTERQQISTTQLMERAGHRVFKHLQEDFLPVRGVIWVFSGTGNNGGDGLVIARYLAEAGHRVRVVLVNFSERWSPDFEVNYGRLRAKGLQVLKITSGAALPQITKEDLVVDAIFGIGLNRRLPDWVESLIVHLNRSSARIISVDVPSGLFMDRAPEEGQAIIRAWHTYTFEFPKLLFLLPGSGGYTRSWSVVGIGLDRDFIAEEETPFFYSDEEEMTAMLKPRDRFSHKGHFGHVLVCGGSYGKIGAPLMTAEAAMTSGSGLVSALVPSCGNGIMQTSVPEVMCVPCEDERMLTDIRADFTPDVVAIGPGMGTHKATLEGLKRFLSGYEGGLVMDADALNLLAGDPALWDHVPGSTILTPHPGEFRRLVGDWGNDLEMLIKARELARQRKVILVLKGACTLVTDGEKVWFNSTGNPGMATGGSGDVLTGVIASLLGQGYTPLQAARLGVYIHGLSGDIAIRQTSEWSLKATDIIDFLGDAFLHLSALGK